jgi:hypothetical protein
MKIKISKSQWQEIGKTGNWIKDEACDNTMVKTKKATQFLDLVEKMDALNDTDLNQAIKDTITTEAKQLPNYQRKNIIQVTNATANDKRLVDGNDGKNLTATTRIAFALQNVLLSEDLAAYQYEKIADSITKAMIAEEVIIQISKRLVDSTNNSETHAIANTIANKKTAHSEKLQKLLYATLKNAKTFGRKSTIR